MFYPPPSALQLKQLQQTLGSRSKTRDANTETEDMAEEGQEGGPPGGDSVEDEGKLSFDLEPAAAPTEEEVRNEMLRLFPAGSGGGGGQPGSTLFAITMLCIAEEYDVQVREGSPIWGEESGDEGADARNRDLIHGEAWRKEGPASRL